MIQISNSQNYASIWKKLEPSGKLPGDRAAHSCDLIQDKLYVFGGWNGINALSDIFIYSFTNNSWQEIVATGDTPSFRNNHTTSVYGTKLYIHGGHNGAAWLDDLYYLETITNPPMWQKVIVTGQAPTARACHSLNRVGKKMYLFGGYDGQECFNEIEILDLVKNHWYQPTVKGQIPTARNAHTMTKYNNRLYLFGGHSGAQHLQDIHYFHTEELQWYHINASGMVPKGLRGHTANLIQNCIYIFGGYDGSGRSNDLYIFNMNSQIWSIPNQHQNNHHLQSQSGDTEDQPGLNQIPQPRQRHSATANDSLVTDEEMIYVFGGFDGNKWLNDLYVLNIGYLESITIQQENQMKVIQNIKNNLFNNKQLSDVYFLVQEQTIYAHKFYLASQCEHFKALFYSGMQDSGLVEYQIANYSYEAFLQFIEYLYVGSVCLENLSFDIQIQILGLADQYTCEGLKLLMGKNIKKSINNETVCQLLIYSQKYSAQTLKNDCMSYLLKNITQISGTAHYEKLEQEPSLLIEVTRAILADAQISLY